MEQLKLMRLAKSSEVEEMILDKSREWRKLKVNDNIDSKKLDLLAQQVYGLFCGEKVIGCGTTRIMNLPHYSLGIDESDKLYFEIEKERIDVVIFIDPEFKNLGYEEVLKSALINTVYDIRNASRIGNKRIDVSRDEEVPFQKYLKRA